MTLTREQIAALKAHVEAQRHLFADGQYRCDNCLGEADHERDMGTGRPWPEHGPECETGMIAALLADRDAGEGEHVGSPTNMVAPHGEMRGDVVSHPGRPDGQAAACHPGNDQRRESAALEPPTQGERLTAELAQMGHSGHLAVVPPTPGAEDVAAARELIRSYTGARPELAHEPLQKLQGRIAAALAAARTRGAKCRHCDEPAVLCEKAQLEQVDGWMEEVKKGEARGFAEGVEASAKAVCPFCFRDGWAFDAKRAPFPHTRPGSDGRTQLESCSAVRIRALKPEEPRA